MFLTQKHLLNVASINGEPDAKIRSQEVTRWNAYLLQKIDDVLQDYPEYPYQVAFSMDELRSKLVTHILNHVANCYSVIGEAREPITNAKFPYPSTSERVRLDVLIRGSILHILRENADWLSRRIQQLDNAVATGWNPLERNDKHELN